MHYEINLTIQYGTEALPLHKLYACVGSNSLLDSSETTAEALISWDSKVLILEARELISFNPCKLKTSEK